MIVTKNGRTYSCTLCRHRGEPCREGLAVLDHLGRSVATAGALLQPGFEMQGCVRLSGCDRACTALFRLTPDRLHLFCDMEPSDWSPDLVEMAELLLGAGGSGRPARARPEPAAMVVAQSARSAAGLH